MNKIYDMKRPYTEDVIQRYRSDYVGLSDMSIISKYEIVSRNLLSVLHSDGSHYYYDPIIRRRWRADFYDTADVMKMILGDRLYFYMSSRGYTQSELSKKSGVSQPCISSYIKGRSAPSYLAIGRIVKALHIEHDVLCPCIANNTYTFMD